MDCCFPVISGFSIQKSTSGYTFISKIFSEFWRGVPTMTSAPLSGTFPTLAKSSSYATGLQLNFSQ